MIRWRSIIGLIWIAVVTVSTCAQKKRQTNASYNHQKTKPIVNAEDILGNPNIQAMAYGGYRGTSRTLQPSIDELKEDLMILSAMDIKLLRTYNVKLPHAATLLQAIHELQQEVPHFEMYVMLGAWIDCKNAWSDDGVDHDAESEENSHEIDRAVMLAQKYPDIVKIISIGNEAMVKWAASYYVQPNVILKWVSHIQMLKDKGELQEGLWVTSSDNFASWGGGDVAYHVKDLELLYKAVDFVSIHTYPMHDTHYNPHFWRLSQEKDSLSKANQIAIAMQKALAYAQVQYQNVEAYMKQLGIDKPIHIGETGWASQSNGLYGANGSKATDEYKEGLYYKSIRKWTQEKGITCFYFEAFDEPWKDASNPEGSENHFGLFTVKGEAKYALWDLVDAGNFKGLQRGGNPIRKTYEGHIQQLLLEVEPPPMRVDDRANR